MSFCSHFNEYLSLLEITYPQFARYSGLSVSAVRRYKNGESEKAKSSFFNSDGYFRISEYFMFCARLMKPEPKQGKGGAPCMIVFCAYQQQNDVYLRRHCPSIHPISQKYSRVSASPGASLILPKVLDHTFHAYV